MKWTLLLVILSNSGGNVTATIPFESEALCRAALERFSAQPGRGSVHGRDGQAERVDVPGLRWGMCFRTRS